MALSGCFFIDCNEALPDLRTSVGATPALSTFPSNPDVVPFIVYLAEYPETCWRVSKSGGPAAILPYNVLNTFPECVTCIEAIPEPPVVNVYILTDCLEVEDPIYSFTSELADAVEQVVKLEGSDVCWGVSTVVFNEQTITDVTIATNEADVPQIFDDCECCLPAPEPAPIKYTRVIPKPDRKFYQIQQSQCDITANIRFADGYYRLFKQLKYGISNQCDGVNLERLWIRKNLSDLAMINDPTACIITTPVTPVICPEPSGNPFIPPAPPITYSFHVNDGGAGTNFSCGGNCLDGSSVPIQQACPAFNFTLDYDILPMIDFQQTYVFTYNGGCVLVSGAWIAAGIDPSYTYTYALQSSNIIDSNYDPDPCQYCPS